jgi:ADP-L-glycero-D-manno-heptose 6-epimerase
MYIVTGGAGFIGSAVIWKLNAMGCDDIVVVDNLASSDKWKNLVNRRYAEYIHRDVFLDLVSGEGLKKRLPGRVEALIHMGACSATTERNADYLMRNNLEYSQTLCRFALGNDIRFINASSAATYGDGSRGFDDDQDGLDLLKPLNMYGYSKHLFDLWARRNGLFNSIIALKFFNVYGPNEYHKNDMRSMANKAFQQITEIGRVRLFRSEHTDYGDGEQRRDFVYVKDCAEIIWWLLENKEVNGLFNIGTGRARSWNDLARCVFRAMDRPENIEYVDMPKELAAGYQYFTEASMKRLAEAGYARPMTPLEDGVSDYVRSYLLGPDPYL